MNNSPIMKLLMTQARGGNVVDELKRMAQQNPEAARAYQIINNNRGNLEQYARNMGQGNGFNVDAMYSQLRQKIGR